MTYGNRYIYSFTSGRLYDAVENDLRVAVAIAIDVAVSIVTSVVKEMKMKTTLPNLT